MNIFFFSRTCQTSKMLFTILKNEGFIEYFKLFCVEDHLNEIPKQLKRVPTLLVSNIKKPLEVEEAFKWVETMKAIKYNQMIEKQKNENVTITNEPQKKLLGYVDTEMGKFSDNFAYVNIDLPVPHTFVGVGEDATNPIYTPPEEKNKISKFEQDKLISQMESVRKIEENDYSQKLRETQAQILLMQQK